MFTLVDEFGYVGTFKTVDECNRIIEHYKNIKFITLEYADVSDTPSVIDFVYVVLLKNNVPCLVSTRERAEVKLKALQAVNLTFDDPIEYWKFPYGLLNRVRNRLDIMNETPEEPVNILDELITA